MSDVLATKELERLEYHTRWYDRLKLWLIIGLMLINVTVLYVMIDLQQGIEAQTVQILDCATTNGECFQERSFDEALNVQTTLVTAVNTCQSEGVSGFDKLESCASNYFKLKYKRGH